MRQHLHAMRRFAGSTARTVWMAGIGLAITLCSSLAPAGPPAGMDLPLNVVQADIDKLTGCGEWWQGFGNRIGCDLWQIQNALFLSPNKADGTVETAEMMALLNGDSECEATPDEILQSRETIIEIVQLLLPDWKKASTWMQDALERATHHHVRNAVRLGPAVVVVNWELRADRPCTFARVAVTKQASFDDWYEHPVAPTRMSIVGLNIAAEEFIEGFTIDATNLDVGGICHVPDGWSLHSSAFSYVTEDIRGQLDGKADEATGLRRERLGELRGLFKVGDPEYQRPLKLRGNVQVRTNGTDKIRKLRLQPSNFLFEASDDRCP